MLCCENMSLLSILVGTWEPYLVIKRANPTSETYKKPSTTRLNLTKRRTLESHQMIFCHLCKFAIRCCRCRFYLLLSTAAATAVGVRSFPFHFATHTHTPTYGSFFVSSGVRHFCYCCLFNSYVVLFYDEMYSRCVCAL